MIDAVFVGGPYHGDRRMLESRPRDYHSHRLLHVPSDIDGGQLTERLTYTLIWWDGDKAAYRYVASR